MSGDVGSDSGSEESENDGSMTLVIRDFDDLNIHRET